MIHLCKSQSWPTAALHVFAVGLGLFLMVPAARANNLVAAWGEGATSNPADIYNYGQAMIPATLTNAVLVTGGWLHSVALKADGTLQGWGNDSFGQLDFPGGTNYMAIACGYLFSLALQANGRVLAEGDADDYYATPTLVPNNLSNVVAIAGGYYHSLALKADGTVAAWGNSTNPDSFGMNFNYGQSLVPAGLSNAVAIAAGAYHSLALKSDGTVTAWGAGSGSDANVDFGQNIVPAGLSNVVAIAAGGYFSLALEAKGQLVAWGDNTYGQTNVPAGLSNVVQIAAGGWHGLALKSDGTVVVWGRNVYGQTNVPTGLSNVVQIAAGLNDSLALVGSGPPMVKVPLTAAGFGTNGFAVVSPTRNGRVYRLECKNSLTNQIWSAFPLQAGLGGTMRFYDPAPSTPQRFYRVSQW